MISHIALPKGSLVLNLHGVEHTITSISHDDGILAEFTCEPHSEELEEISASHLSEHLELKTLELQRAVSRANKR